MRTWLVDTGPLVATSGMDVYDLCQPPELHEAVRLMEKYTDTPMDFADATLVLLGEGLEVREVLTLDRRVSRPIARGIAGASSWFSIQAEADRLLCPSACG